MQTSAEEVCMRKKYACNVRKKPAPRYKKKDRVARVVAAERACLHLVGASPNALMLLALVIPVLIRNHPRR